MPIFLNDVAKVWVWMTGFSGYLNAALCGALITVFVGGMRARRERRITALQEQLRLLYGPVAALAHQNLKLFELTEAIQKAHSKYFGVGAFRESDSEERQAAVLQAAASTTNLGNMYIKRVVENNARVMAIIDSNWHLVDGTDRDVFSKFQVEYIRYLTEAEQKGTAGVPVNVIFDIGGHEIAFMRPEMITGVTSAFERKRTTVEEGRNCWW
jgi:hypothetical protein